VGLREYKKQQTRLLLLSSAEKMFSERDFETISVEDIVSEAKISKKTFFNYFSSKNKMLEEWTLDWFTKSNLWSNDSNIKVKDNSILIPPNIDELLDWIANHRRIFKMVLTHTNILSGIYLTTTNSNTKIYDIFLPFRAPRLARVKIAQQSGLIRDDISAELICDMYDTLRFDIIRKWLIKDNVDSNDLKKQFHLVMKVLLDGFNLQREK
jgi:AcrR family transcriptional regulator